MSDLKINLGCGLDRREGWLNVDKLHVKGADEIVDLFRFPWPWDDGMASEMYAGHLIEHIPHDWKSSDDIGKTGACDWSRFRLYQDQQLDGFFVFFSEVWRVLAKDGTIMCVAPFGQSVRALQDPSHTRSIVCETVSYLLNTDVKNTFDYCLPFCFELVNMGFTPSAGSELVLLANQLGNTELALSRTRSLWNQIETINFTLRKLSMQ